MRQEKSARDKALFRYSVVSQVRGLTARGIPLASAVKMVATNRHSDMEGKARKVSKRSVYRWLKSFEDGEFDALFDNPKDQIAFSDVLPESFENLLRLEKKRNPTPTIPEIIRKAEKKGLIESTDEVSRVTVWRACQRLGLPTTRPGLLAQRDMRRFSYEHRMQMVLCDGKHFKVGPKRLKRVAMVFIDDATRHVLHGVCGTSESTELFLRALFEAIKRHGLMVGLYVDNGSGFISNDTLEICAKLDINLIHGEAAYPEGHGKIERFNRTFKQDLLRYWDGEPGIDPSCGSLSLRIQNYFKHDYGERYHEGVKGIPGKLFSEDSRPLEFPASTESLMRYFVIRENRRVSKDNCISMDGVAYEMPLGYAGTTQEIRRYALEGRLLFLHEGKLIELAPVDLSGNARARRQKSSSPSKSKAPSTSGEPPSASMTFDQNYGPIIDGDGGFSHKEHEND